MKTVVTGGAGFIGSHLVKRLLNEEREVVIADDFSRGSIRNLSNFGIKTRCETVDLRDYSQALKLIDGADSVFHLAARIGSVKFLHGSGMDELSALQTNLVIDTNVFRACLERGVKRLVYPSSAAIYPVNEQYSLNVVISEDDSRQTNPDGGYGWAKLLGEVQLGWVKDIKIGIARIFNVYGENAVLGSSAHVIPDLIRKALLYPEEEFTVWGNGEQTRDFLYASDCAEALLKLEQRASNPPLTVNIGSGEAISIKQIADKIAELSGKGMKPRYQPEKPVGPLSRTANIAKAKELLGWQPKTSFEEGLKHTYAWVEKTLAK